MGIQQWSDDVLVVDLADDPLLTDDLGALFDRLTGNGERDVLLDFSAVTFLNSSNIALLLRLRKLQRDRKGRLRLCGITDSVWSVFTVTGLDNLFEFSPQLATGLAALQIESSAPRSRRPSGARS